MYEMVNEELMIKSCVTRDLTLEQIVKMSQEWGGARPEGFTFFADSDGAIVINKDCEDYDQILDLVEAYLSLSEEKRTEAKNRIESLYVILAARVMDNALETRAVVKELEISKHQDTITGMDAKVINAMANLHDNMCVAMSYAFNYGVMQGKRMERARRRK